MRLIILMLAASLTACSYTPVVDFRASQDEAQLYQRDLMECRELAKPFLKAKNEKVFGIIPFCTSAECMAWGQPNFDPMKKCLVNRGHSILN